MALTESEQRKRAAMLRSASAFGGPTREAVAPSSRTPLPDPSVDLKAPPPSKVPGIQALGGGLTTLASAGAGAGFGAIAGPLGAIAGALVGLIGGLITDEVASARADKEFDIGRQVEMENRRELGKANLQKQRALRAGQRADAAAAAAATARTPVEAAISPSTDALEPGAASSLTQRLLG